MRRLAPDLAAALTMVLDVERHPLGSEQRAALLLELRADPELSRQIDEKLIERLTQQHQALLAAREAQAKLEEVLEKFSSPPHYPAVFVELDESGETAPRALVRHGAREQIVAVGDEVDPQELQKGDGVLLARELNVIIGRAPPAAGHGTEICVFEQQLSDGRLVVQGGANGQCIVTPAAGLEITNLKTGAQLECNIEARFAYGVVEKSISSPHFIEETPRETFADIGGLGWQIERVTTALSLHLESPELARLYQLTPVRSVLLHGPSGTGKTLIAKALANWLAQQANGQPYFMSVKPGALGSQWYSMSEANIRELFAAARETAARNPGARVVIYFDEIDGIGGMRGTTHMRVNDSVLNALLSELDGLADRGDVVVVGATNRRELLDPALVRPGRLGDLVVEVPRPNRAGAREILRKRLGPGVPFGRNGHGDDQAATRADTIEAAVSMMYAPNGSGELATLTFRDGRRRPVRAADVLSGAVLTGIAQTAGEAACLRHKRGGDRGLLWGDLALAIEQRLFEAVAQLAPENCRNYLTGLPHDLDVVNVELASRFVTLRRRLLNPG